MYLRLSMEDKKGMDESNSISSQRELIRSFIAQDTELREYRIREFSDDGWSGTGMNRPGMSRLLEEVKKNRIQCIIVKDMSRFSRDYIEMGTYLNQIFPFMGVRFISLGDHYDSREQKGEVLRLDTVFQTFLYDLYSKDVSVKVRASLENKYLNGEYAFGQAPFGYAISREVQGKVIVNEKEAKVVRYIFTLAAQGKSSTWIAKQLYREKVPTASQMRGLNKEKEEKKPHTWSSSFVRKILDNRFYLGEMAYGKTVRKSVGSRNGVAVPKEDWKVIPNHHEALVTPELFERASSFRPVAAAEKQQSSPAKSKRHPFTGRLYCGGCRYSMVYKPIRGKNRYRRFECRKHAMLQIPECCTYFRADVLEELVLFMLNKELLVRGEAEEQEKFLHVFQKSRIAAIRRQLNALDKEKRQMLSSKDALYEEYAAGRISAEEYRQKADKLDSQEELLDGKMRGQREKIVHLEEEDKMPGADMKQVIRYSCMEEFTQELADAFIERIYVYKDKRVEIEWKFRQDNHKLQCGAENSSSLSPLSK